MTTAVHLLIYALKFSWVVSHVMVEQKLNIFETCSVFIVGANVSNDSEV
jgi:hypothetical protein